MCGRSVVLAYHALTQDESYHYTNLTHRPLKRVTATLDYTAHGKDCERFAFVIVLLVEFACMMRLLYEG